jgi:xanthine dehydrogenase accessory factor
MTFWLDDLTRLLDEGQAAMAVQVAAVRGSAPREAGARMIVTANALHGTIGGGMLEWEATAEARSRLRTIVAGKVDEIVLGPALGQCCGGAVTLVYEPFAPADLAWVRRLAAAVAEADPVYRLYEISSGRGPGRSFVVSRSAANDRPGWAAAAIESLVAAGGGFHADVEAGRVRIAEQVAPGETPLWLFGAGHVGRAVAHALEPLPFAVTWVDGRLDAFPADVPAGVRTLALAMPDLIVDEAPAGAFWLVMTHSHSLDFDICEAVLRRGDAAYIGLIGSKTKHATLIARLRRRGLNDDVIGLLTCPIGLPGILGKQPGVIAASVAADLLQRVAQQAVRQDSRVEEGR